MKASEEAAVVNDTTEPAPVVESGVEDANEDVTLVEEAAASSEVSEPGTVCVGDGNTESATVEVEVETKDEDSSEVALPTTEDMFLTESIDVGDQSAHVVQEATEPGVEYGNEKDVKASEEAAVTEPALEVESSVEDGKDDVVLVEEAAAGNEVSEPATVCVEDGNTESATVGVGVETKDEDSLPTTEDMFVTEKSIDVDDQSAHVVQEATEPGGEYGIEEGVKASEEAAVANDTTEPAPVVESGVGDVNEDIAFNVGAQWAHDVVQEETTESGGMVQSPPTAVCEEGIDIQGSVSTRIRVACCQIISERNSSCPIVVSCHLK